MAASILSQDLIGICLVLIDGDSHASIEDVIEAAEHFQKKHHRHFGTSTADFRELFWSVFNFNLSEIQNFHEISLYELIPFILSFHAAHFNDEGATLFGDHIDTGDEAYEQLDIRSWHGYSEDEYRQKMATKAEMQEYFRDKSRTSEAVREWMTHQKINDHLIFHCSRPGDVS